MIAEVVASIMFLGVVLYACFGGADFGVGIWDLTAGNAKKGAAMRSLIDRAIGPVWEANHVWLIFVLVYLWSGFPDAFATICEDLWVPLSLAGLGIVFRGATFAFRKFSPTFETARLFGVLFALSSLITPFFFGVIAGAVASGESATSETSIIGGVVAVLTCAFLAAVFLTHEASRINDAPLLAACRKRALISGAITGVAVMAFIAPLHSHAPILFDGLTGRALPLVIVSAVGGIVTLIALFKNRTRIARGGALIAVASVVIGWGVAQYPYLVVDTIDIDAAQGASATLWGLVIVFGVAAVTVVPALVYLYWITQRSSWVVQSH